MTKTLEDTIIVAKLFSVHDFKDDFEITPKKMKQCDMEYAAYAMQVL